MSTHFSCLMLTLVLSTGEDKPTAYPRTDMLVDPGELARPGVAEKYRILDAREKAKYEKGHVPGAVWVDHDRWAKEDGENVSGKDWERRIGSLGIAAETKVVIYDDVRFNRAARIWWLLRAAGVKDVWLLNGGWKGWQAAGGAASKDVPKIEPVKFQAKPQPDRVASKDFVLRALDEKNWQIIDSRSKLEYLGQDKRAKRGGAIPGAHHLEWSDTIDPKTHRFKSADELKKLFADAGIDPSKPCTSYCQSGGRASVMAFTLELMGGKDVRNYYKSWAEWGNDEETPIEKK
ncbi:MAG TPA: sulfurtransferase [Gemmataceae bacterium]|nr:sulfurtransferase [Gemmataceae bacterium]